MLRFALSLLLLLASSNAALAYWQVYREDSTVVAAVDYVSFAPFHDQPSVWVRWHYVKPKDGVGGVKLHFTARCKEHRLFEIASYPYDPDGNYLTPHERYDSPKEYPVTPGSLNEATYRLLCP